MTSRITINELVVDFVTPCIAYEEVVTLAGCSGTEYLVKYSSKRDDIVRREGTLMPGASVLITDVMAFRVSRAGGA